MASPAPTLAQAVGCADGPCPGGGPVLAMTLNPLKWLGDGVTAIAADGWRAAMTALWSAGLWVMELVFKIIDAFLEPDLRANGPMGKVFGYTFAVGLMLALIMALLQIGVALFQRDGRSVARVLVGVVQFGAVWIGYVGVAAALVVGTSGLTKGMLQGLLGIDVFGAFNSSASWPRKVNDTVVATVLGLCTVTLIFPSSVVYLLIMLGREAALIVLTATSPISAGGLLAEGTRSWFWKTLRWFLAALAIAPLSALVLGIGVKVSEGVILGNGDKTVAAVGMAFTGSILFLVGAICPLLLFKLLAFVDPGTGSGMAMRQALAVSGGVTGLLSGGGSGGAAPAGAASAGSGAATSQDGQGRSQGESSADSATQSRFGAALGMAGGLLAKGATAVPNAAAQAASIGSDVLGSAGVGHQVPYFGQGEYGGGAAPGGTGGDGQSARGGGDAASPGGGDGGGGGGQSAAPAGEHHTADGAETDSLYLPPPPPPPPLRGARQDSGGPSPDATAA